MRKTIIGLLIGAASMLTACSTSPPPAVPTVAAVAPQKAADDLVQIKPSADYPLKICVVSNEKLDPDRLAYRYKGKEIQFCCSHCIDDFRKDPDKYMAKLDAAEAKLPR